jgi:hypothetical protein
MLFRWSKELPYDVDKTIPPGCHTDLATHRDSSTTITNIGMSHSPVYKR